MLFNPRTRRRLLHGSRHRRAPARAALRIAGASSPRFADIGSDLKKIVFTSGIPTRGNPGVIADCVATTPGDSVGPSADGFET